MRVRSIRRKKQEKKKRIFLLRRRILLLSCLGLFFAILILPVQIKIWRLEGDLNRLQKEQTALLQKREDYERMMKYYASDAYVEKKARQELGLVRPGEALVVPAVPGMVQTLSETKNNPYGD